MTSHIQPGRAEGSPRNRMDDIGRYFYFYGLAIILPVGLLCNLLCFGVFLNSYSLRRTTTGHYLIALAVADTLLLSGELLRWMNAFDSKGQILGIDFMETILFWCQFTFHLRYAGKLASAWITVVISVERFITVAYPLKVARISTPRIAKSIIGLVFFICFALGSFPWWTLGLKYSNKTYCGYMDEEAYNAWTLAILIVGSLFIPSVIMFVVTFLIIFQLKKANKDKKKLERGQRKHNGGRTVKRSVEIQLTVMLISVAIAFLILRLPYTITFYIQSFKFHIWGENMDPDLRNKLYAANGICDMIEKSNYAINFFLYCLSGSAFRSRLVKFIRCQRNSVKRRILFTSKLSTNHLFTPARDVLDVYEMR